MSPSRSSSRLADALEWLDRHWNLEAQSLGVAPGTSPRHPSLDRMVELMSLSGNPQEAYPVLHITGTNGKTSTARILSALLDAMGLAVGTYTSPHLEMLNERIVASAIGTGRRAGGVVGEPIPDAFLADHLEQLRGLEPLMPSGARPSWFELVTAVGFRHFADLAVDAAVVEVGLGGRWDATNVVNGAVAMITNVGLDHVEYLGPTVADIAGEKAGIIKPGAVVVVGEPDPALQRIFQDEADRVGAEALWVVGRDFEAEGNELAVDGRLLDLRTPEGEYHEVFLSLHGRHQGRNAAVALAAAEAFFGGPLAADVVEEALARVTSPGRLEIVGSNPLVLLDGAHNPAGAAAAAQAIAEEFGRSGKSRVVVLGLVRPHDPAEMLASLDPARIRLVVACPAPSPRSVEASAVADAARALGIDAIEESTVASAVETAVEEAHDEEMVLVTGSLYVVGAARAALHP